MHCILISRQTATVKNISPVLKEANKKGISFSGWASELFPARDSVNEASQNKTVVSFPFCIGWQSKSSATFRIAALKLQSELLFLFYFEAPLEQEEWVFPSKLVGSCSLPGYLESGCVLDDDLTRNTHKNVFALCIQEINTGQTEIWCSAWI